MTDQLIQELLPYLNAHWTEIVDDELPPDPDWKKYRDIEAAGAFKVFTARDDAGELVGYNAFFIHSNLHHRSSLQAVQDVIYIDKSRRGFGRTFIGWCGDQLREMGAQRIYLHVNAEHNFGPMLEQLGYKLMDLVYCRQTDVA